MFRRDLCTVSNSCVNCTSTQTCFNGNCIPIPSNFRSWPNKAWLSKNKSYSTTNKSYEDCYNDCVNDKKCKTLTAFRTYDVWPERPCNYFDTAITSSDIGFRESTWEGTVESII